MKLKTITALVFAAFTLTASAQKVSNDEILSLVAQQDTYIRNIRKHFHQYPELGGHEIETVKYLKNEVKQTGKDLEIHDVPGSTGFYVIFDTGKPGKTLGLRTDIDGLPILESPTNTGGKQKKWVSLNKGVMQGCGHDGHMAILLATLKILHQLKPRLTGKYVFLFEEGEETNTGIRPMIAAIKNIHFDAIYGNHVASGFPTGKIYLVKGPQMAGMATISMYVIGKGGHASRPDKCINPVYTGADILSSEAIAWNSARDLTKLVTLGITQFNAGKVYNVIPDSAYIGGTLRFFNKEAGEHALQLFENVATKVAEAHGAHVAFTEHMKVDLPPLDNDSTLAGFAQKEIDDLYPGSIFSNPEDVSWGSETFALYKQIAPIVMTQIGVGSDKVGSFGVHHTATFDLDEDGLPYGVGAMVKFATSFQDQGK